MSKANYGYNKKVSFSFDQAVEKVKEELQKEGFAGDVPNQRPSAPSRCLGNRHSCL